MKLWIKLALTTVLVLLAATLSTGAAVISQALLYSLEKTMESGLCPCKGTGKRPAEGVQPGY